MTEGHVIADSHSVEIEPRFVVELDDEAARDPALTGGKSAALARAAAAELGERLGESKKEGADKIDQRLMRLHYTFERYQESLPGSHIIRYEDICSSRGKALEVIVPAAGGLDEPLENKNLNPLYHLVEITRGLSTGPEALQIAIHTLWLLVVSAAGAWRRSAREKPMRAAAYIVAFSAESRAPLTQAASSRLLSICASSASLITASVRPTGIGTSAC
jgi:hypothetical protein